jgi:CheY-like chemotaxis protein
MMDASTPRGPDHAAHILIVDDDDDIRETLMLVLESRGYEVTGAANGREALQYLRAHDLPCAVLLDLMMPVMDGWQFREETSRDPSLAQVPLVVLTGGGDNMKRTRPLRAAAWLDKPIPLEKLVKTLEQIC